MGKRDTTWSGLPAKDARTVLAMNTLIGRESGADHRIPTVLEAARLTRDVLLFAREECTAWRPYVQEALDRLIAALDKKPLREVRETRLQGERWALLDGVQHREFPDA